MHNFRVRAHEYTEAVKTTEIKKNNQVLLEKLLDISKGKNVLTDFYLLLLNIGLSCKT